MKDWESDTKGIKNNIKQELNLLTSETDKLILLNEIMMELDREKLPPMIRKKMDFME